MFNARQLPEMPSKNRSSRHSKISEARFRYLLRLFAMDLTATDAAQLCGLSVRSVNALYTSVCVSAWLGSAPLSLLSQASLRPMSPLSAPSVSGANVGVARVAKPSSLVCSSKATVSYRDHCRCLQSHAASHYSGQSWIPTASSTPTVGEAATGWLIWVWTSTFGSITPATNSSRAVDTR